MQLLLTAHTLSAVHTSVLVCSTALRLPSKSVPQVPLHVPFKLVGLAQSTNVPSIGLFGPMVQDFVSVNTRNNAEMHVSLVVCIDSSHAVRMFGTSPYA